MERDGKGQNGGGGEEKKTNVIMKKILFTHSQMPSYVMELM